MSSGLIRNKNFLGGLLLVAIGGFAAIHAGLEYQIGSLAEMGPGYFPLALGLVLAGFGLALAARGLTEARAPVHFDLLPFAAVICATLFFALTIEPLGLVPAVIGTALIALLPMRRMSLARAVLLAVLLAFFCAVLFYWGLSIQVPLIYGYE